MQWESEWQEGNWKASQGECQGETILEREKIFCLAVAAGHGMRWRRRKISKQKMKKYGWTLRKHPPSLHSCHCVCLLTCVFWEALYSPELFRLYCLGQISLNQAEIEPYKGLNLAYTCQNFWFSGSLASSANFFWLLICSIPVLLHFPDHHGCCCYNLSPLFQEPFVGEVKPLRYKLIFTDIKHNNCIQTRDQAKKYP